MNNDNGSQNFGVRIDTDALRRDAQTVRQEFHQIGNTAVSEGNRMDAAFQKIGKAVAGVFAVSQAKDFAVQIAKVRGEFQQLEIAFKTMLGSASQADKLMSQLIKTAATTPFGMSDIANSAKQLLAYGVAADEVNETLIRLGDIAAGLSIPINDLAYLYGTTMTQGRVFTQDLRQFMGRGIPLAEELAKQFGVTKDKIGEMVTKGKVGFPEVKKAIWDMTNEGSKFGGLMEAQSKTITGQISNLEDAIEQMFNEIGRNSEGLISDTIGVASSIVDNYEQVGRVIGGLIGVYGTYKVAVMTVTALQGLQAAGVGALTAAEAAHYSWLVLCEKAQALLNKTMLANPYVLAAAALATLIAVMVSQRTEQERVNDAYKDYTNKVQDAIAKEEEHKAKIEKLIGVAGDESLATETRKAALVKLEMQYPSIFAKYDTEYEKLKHIRDIKMEIAALDGQKSLANPQNELSNVEKRIKELQGIHVNEFISLYGGKQHTGRNRTADEEAELKALLRRRSELQNSVKKEQAADYLSNLTGVSNADLQKQINERRNLLAKMEADEKKYGKVQQGGATGVYTKDEIQGQLQTLQAEQTRRKQIIENGSKDFLKEANAAYKKEKAALDKLRSLSDPNKRKKSDLVVGGKKVSEMSSDEYFDALKLQEQAVKDAKEKARIKDGGKNAQTEKQRLENEAAQRKDAMRKYRDEVSREAAKTELDIRQAQIDNLDDGFDKQQKQIKLNYDKLIAENAERERQMLEALADAKVTEWKDKNPKATQAQELDYRASLNLSSSDLTQTQRDQLKAYQQAADEYIRQANRHALEDMMQDVLTYEQKREKVTEEYAKRRAALYQEYDTPYGTVKMRREGVTEANEEELKRQEQQALEAVDEEFASRSEAFQAWCNEIGNLSLRQLEAVLKKAQEELNALKGSGKATTEQVAVAQAKVAKAQKAVKQARAKEELNPGTRTIKEWEDLYKTLGECANEFKNIGSAVGGTVGEILTAAGTVATSTLSMINGILQLTTMSATSMKATAVASAAAMQTVEKASVILTIISAALQIATTIANMFNDDEEKQEEIERLQQRIDQLQWELDNPEIVRLQERNGKAIDLMNRAIQETNKELATEYEKIRSISNLWERMSAYGAYNQKVFEESAKKMADAYANVAYTADKAVGSDRFANSRRDLENIAQQQLLIKQQIEEEQDKKDSDSGAIADWEQKIEELGAKAVSLINDMIEEIMGGSANDIAKQLSDAFFEAFEAGEDAAEKWGDKVNDIVKDILKRMLVSKFLEEPLGDIFNKYKQKWFKDGNFQGIDAIISSMEEFRSDLNGTYDVFKDVMSAIPDDMKEMFMGAEDTRTAAEKGIAQASQDSVDELNGRATAIQGHTFSIAENTRLLLSTANAILKSVTNIEGETVGLKDKMNDIKSDVNTLRRSVDDIALKGIKIKS